MYLSRGKSIKYDAIAPWRLHAQRPARLGKEGPNPSESRNPETQLDLQASVRKAGCHWGPGIGTEHPKQVGPWHVRRGVSHPMSRSYWLSIFAIVGWLIGSAALAVPPEKGYPHQPGKIERNEAEASGTKKQRQFRFAIPFGVCASFPASIDGLARPEKPTEDNYYKPEDLKAQQTTACFTEWIFYSTVLQFALSCFGAFLLFRTIRLAGASNKIARTIGEEQTRAYVYASSFCYDSARSANAFVVCVKNGGQTPAKHFCVRQVLYITDDHSPRQHAFPKSIRNENWGSLGPGEIYSIPAPPHSEVGIQSVDGKLPASTTYNVIGTIRYMTIHDEWFETDYTFLCESSRMVAGLKVGTKVEFTRPIVGNLRAFERANIQTEIE